MSQLSTNHCPFHFVEISVKFSQPQMEFITLKNLERILTRIPKPGNNTLVLSFFPGNCFFKSQPVFGAELLSEPGEAHVFSENSCVGLWDNFEFQSQTVQSRWDLNDVREAASYFSSPIPETQASL